MSDDYYPDWKENPIVDGQVYRDRVLGADVDVDNVGGAHRVYRAELRDGGKTLILHGEGGGAAIHRNPGWEGSREMTRFLVPMSQQWVKERAEVLRAKAAFLERSTNSNNSEAKTA